MSKARDIELKLQETGLWPVVKLTYLKDLDYLGQGTYAFVKLALDLNTNNKVALKIFDKKTLIVKRRLENLIVR